MNALPLYFGSSEIKNAKIENVTLQLDKPSLIPEAVLPFVEKTVVNINIVLSTIIPSLNIRIRYLNKEVMRNGTIGINISLLSEKDGREMPLKYESEGIKKIISILHFFITAYNLPFVTLAIDELDSGIFEYLLGELLRIFSNGGKGQLVFTSHNLRPLETIDRNFIAFTTTNPSNRYMRMRNIKATNNVRDMYYRNLIFNEQVTKDTDFETRLYDKIENYEIARALEKAGDLT